MSGMNIVILGLSITSSWGNGHAGTWRSLIAALARRGHRVTFFERDLPWHAKNRDLPDPPYCSTGLYRDFEELRVMGSRLVRQADLVIVGSRVPQGAEIGAWVLQTASGLTAFYDLDTPVTLAGLVSGECEYLDRRLIHSYDLYLSFTGGPTLERLEREFGSPAARALPCSVDLARYHPFECAPAWDLGYLGAYSRNRQPALDELLVRPARRWKRGRLIVAGPHFPADIDWPRNVERRDYLSPPMHPEFYNRQRYTLNVTRAEMVRAGWSPSVRLFEAAACGTAIISDWWQGLDEFFTPGEEILIALSTQEVIFYLRELGERERRALGQAARERAERDHSSDARARELERLVAERDERRREQMEKHQAAEA